MFFSPPEDATKRRRLQKPLLPEANATARQLKLVYQLSCHNPFAGKQAGHPSDVGSNTGQLKAPKEEVISKVLTATVTSLYLERLSQTTATIK